MISDATKECLDREFAAAPEISFTKYIRDRRNYTSWNQGTGYALVNLDQDSQLLATMNNGSDEQLFVVRTADGIYHLIEEDSNQRTEPRVLEDDGSWYDVDIIIDPEEDTSQEVRCGLEDLIRYSVTERFSIIENNAWRPEPALAAQYPLDPEFHA